MRDIARIARVQALLVRRNIVVFSMHALGLLTLVMMASVQIRTDPAQLPLLLMMLMLAAAIAGPITIGVHTLVSERSRGTLEALLALPIRRRTLLAGKGSVVLLIALGEILGVWIWFLVLGSLTGTAGILTALASPGVLLVLCAGAPLLAALVTLTMLIVSGHARDAQNASNLGFLAGAPMTALVLGLWFAAGVLPLPMAGLAIAVTVFLCAAAARVAATWLSDDRLLSRRG